MNLVPAIAILLIIFASCGQAGPEVKPADSTGNAQQIDSSENFSEDLATFRKEFIDTYNQVIEIDTSFQLTGQQYKIKFKHYCTHDSALVVPALYNFDTKKDFRTHNFKSTLVVISGTDTVFKTTIEKSLFNQLLNTEKVKYAALLYPDLTMENDSIQVHYSISIPVTDVGVAAYIRFDKQGNYRVFN